MKDARPLKDIQVYSCCRPQIATDGGRDITHDTADTTVDTPNIGIRHDLDELPPDFTELSNETQRAIAGGFSRPDLIDLVRDYIGSTTTTKTDRLAKPELVTVLIQLHIGSQS